MRSSVAQREPRACAPGHSGPHKAPTADRPRANPLPPPRAPHPPSAPPPQAASRASPRRWRPTAWSGCCASTTRWPTPSASRRLRSASTATSACSACWRPAPSCAARCTATRRRSGARARLLIGEPGEAARRRPGAGPWAPLGGRGRQTLLPRARPLSLAPVRRPAPAPAATPLSPAAPASPPPAPRAAQGRGAAARAVPQGPRRPRPLRRAAAVDAAAHARVLPAREGRVRRAVRGAPLRQQRAAGAGAGHLPARRAGAAAGADARRGARWRGGWAGARRRALARAARLSRRAPGPPGHVRC
jgi:hypothetical protein